MLKKSFTRKSKKLLKSRNKKRVSKKSQKKISKKKAFSPSAAVIVPVVIGTLGLLTASGYYGIKYYKEKKYKDQINSFRQEIVENVIKNKENKENKDCNICLEKIGDVNNYEELPCKHIFHKSCMQQWRESQFITTKNWKFFNRGVYKLDYTCPICRFVYDSIIRDGQSASEIIRNAGKHPEYYF